MLASGRRTPREEVDAYRVLARVSPASYLPRLVKALLSLTYDTRLGRRHPASLALCEEAVAVARTVDPAEPARADLLYRALDACQRELYDVGRRAEGLALRAEMLSIGRAQAERSGSPVVRGLRDWAAGCSEEGRYAEAADALTEWVAAILPDGPSDGTLAWSLLEWIAALHDAGRPDEALAAYRTLVDMEADEAAGDRGPIVCHLYSLIGYARLLDTYGRGSQAAAVRQEALAVLTGLHATGERKSWSGYQASFWAVLLSCSGADSERPAAGEPRPPFGATPMEWSPDVRRRYVDSRAPSARKWTPSPRGPTRIRTGTWPNWSGSSGCSPSVRSSTGWSAPICSRSESVPCSTKESVWPAGCTSTIRGVERGSWPRSSSTGRLSVPLSANSVPPSTTSERPCVTWERLADGHRRPARDSLRATASSRASRHARTAGCRPRPRRTTVKMRRVRCPRGS
ncbi:hypothetical protein RKD23_000538 [Streptomyces sp. SAI-170]